MLSPKHINHFETLLSEKIKESYLLSGGDINSVYALITKNQKVVIKLNSNSKFPGLFEAEAAGLQKLRDCNCFVIPDVLQVGTLGDDAFLMMPYIAKGEKITNFSEEFGKRLAQLHRESKPYFGFEEDNYIGSLSQKNTKCKSAFDFYIVSRLEPQFNMAIQKGFAFLGLDMFYKNIENEIPSEKSSLVHGDLWNGNYIINEEGLPCLIDPAVAYASREMDIAMMHLFGGFDNRIFEVYHDTYPLIENWKIRQPIWQLYYLLIHLNLFGVSYYQQVKTIVKMYS